MPDREEVRVLGPEEWATWRDIRLRALRESPGAFGSTYAEEAGFSDRVWRDRLADPGSVCVLVLADGAPVAMGGGFTDGPGLLHVVAMWVEPSARRRGHGHLVLDALRDRAAEHGQRLHLDVYSGNPGARRCYERYGFEATGQTRPVREGSAEVAERMLLP